MSEGTTVVSPQEALPEVRRLLGKLKMEATADTGNGGAMAIMEAMLRAETEEELFDRQEAGTVSSKDYIGRPFRLLPEGITWKRSAIGYVEQGAFPFYALLNVTDMETGDTVVIDSGSLSVISILDKLLEFDADENRSLSERPFERFRDDGGKPMQFAEKTVASGFNVVMLKPVTLVEPKPARSGKKV